MKRIFFSLLFVLSVIPQLSQTQAQGFSTVDPNVTSSNCSNICGLTAGEQYGVCGLNEFTITKGNTSNVDGTTDFSIVTTNTKNGSLCFAIQRIAQDGEYLGAYCEKITFNNSSNDDVVVKFSQNIQNATAMIYNPNEPTSVCGTTAFTVDNRPTPTPTIPPEQSQCVSGTNQCCYISTDANGRTVYQAFDENNQLQRLCGGYHCLADETQTQCRAAVGSTYGLTSQVEPTPIPTYSLDKIFKKQIECGTEGNYCCIGNLTLQGEPPPNITDPTDSSFIDLFKNIRAFVAEKFASMQVASDIFFGTINRDPCRDRNLAMHFYRVNSDGTEMPFSKISAKDIADFPRIIALLRDIRFGALTMDTSGQINQFQNEFSDVSCRCEVPPPPPAIPQIIDPDNGIGIMGVSTSREEPSVLAEEDAFIDSVILNKTAYDYCDPLRETDEFGQCVKCVGEDEGTWTAIGCVYADLSTTIQEKVFGWGIGVAGMIAFGCIIYAAFIMQTSQGNPEQVKKAQDLLTSCITGLIVVIMSVFILRVIGVDILRIPGFDGPTDEELAEELAVVVTPAVIPTAPLPTSPPLPTATPRPSVTTAVITPSIATIPIITSVTATPTSLPIPVASPTPPFAQPFEAYDCRTDDPAPDEVFLYDQQNHTGNCVRMLLSESNFLNIDNSMTAGQNGWNWFGVCRVSYNDCIASLEFGSNIAQVQVFRDSDYKGDSHIFLSSEDHTKLPALFTDTVSSIVIIKK